ncbi:MAG: amidohydrolase family protein, partial [Chloroflexi bacterium]|nr:amidohydrolase family protein [Chloroflexota bacterium]
MLTKDFPVFDCDAHINDPHTIWSEYVEPKYRELVRASFWKDGEQSYVNGRTAVPAGTKSDVAKSISYNPATVAGPGMGDKRILRRLQQMKLTPEQKDYLDHKGAEDGAARLPDMDLMGIDQVLVIPTMIVNSFIYMENVDAANALARAYNNWVYDYCKPSRERLYGAAILPLQNPLYSVREIERVRKMGFPVGLIRPSDAKGLYPNRINAAGVDSPGIRGYSMDAVYRAFEETGLVVGMHTLPITSVAGSLEAKATMDSPSQFLHRTREPDGRYVDIQTMGFVWEGATWLAQVLLSGFLDRYPRLKMAIFETNATWALQIIENCDRLFKLYRNERKVSAKRLPSEAFAQQCVIGFESDEKPVFRLWEQFQDVGIWASDAYHHDGSGAWEALNYMAKETGVVG